MNKENKISSDASDYILNAIWIEKGLLIDLAAKEFLITYVSKLRYRPT